jgi:hypothetical protein
MARFFSQGAPGDDGAPADSRSAVQGEVSPHTNRNAAGRESGSGTGMYYSTPGPQHLPLTLRIARHTWQPVVLVRSLAEHRAVLEVTRQARHMVTVIPARDRSRPGSENRESGMHDDYASVMGHIRRGGGG